jgi:two-component sensor histidine kinase
MAVKWLIACVVLLITSLFSFGQKEKSPFRVYRNPEVPNNYFGEILVTTDGQVFVSSSEYSFLLITGGNVGAFTFGLDKQDYGIRNLESVFTGAPIKEITNWRDGAIYFATARNQITYLLKKGDDLESCDIPPFYFPPKGEAPKDITELWLDGENNLFIGVSDDAFYMVPGAGDMKLLDKKNYQIERTPDSNMVITRGEMPVKKITCTSGVYSFGENRTSKNIIWIGSGRGLLAYNKTTGELDKVWNQDSSLTITHIEVFANGDVWFSTLEKGMGVYHSRSKTSQFFAYPKKSASTPAKYPVQDFCLKSNSTFLVAVKDSFPAIFNLNDGSYEFMDDSSFNLSKNNTTDIRLDSNGNFYFIKGGLLFSANLAEKPAWIGNDTGLLRYKPIIYGVTDFKRHEITNFLTAPEKLQKLKLRYDENSIIIYLTSDYHSQTKKTQFAWKLEGDVNNWVEMPFYATDNDSTSQVELPDIKPGKYVFKTKVRIGEGDWSQEEAKMEIIVTPAYWTTWWFWLFVIAGILLVFYIIIKLRVKAVRKTERLKARYEKDLMELEAKALRAQMNPHFVFNCLNSIKALMQENQNEKGVTYLTTFSKLIRTLFNNADKKEISLHDEIETCKYYLQLEAMRFDGKFTYSVKVDEGLDLKSIAIPALIVQPFIENAIWHGIVPKGNGEVSLSVQKQNNGLQVIVEDNGIGREASQQNKSLSGLAHQSRGVTLTQSRLRLDNLLQQRKASIETVDKHDEHGKAAGTKVIISLNEEI